MGRACAVIQRGRWAALILLVLTAVLPGWAAEVPHMGPQRGADIPSSADPNGWMVWYEDETFEDCGVMLNGERLADDHCSDIWQPALSRPVATEEVCKMLLTQYSTSAEDFRCSRERPEPQNDDWSDSSSGRH